MEVNENTVLQNGKMEDEYVRIGTTLFRILNQPMMNGSFRKMLVSQNACGVEDECVPARP